jgi:hypothetical protein
MKSIVKKILNLFFKIKKKYYLYRYNIVITKDMYPNTGNDNKYKIRLKGKIIEIQDMSFNYRKIRFIPSIDKGGVIIEIHGYGSKILNIDDFYKDLNKRKVIKNKKNIIIQPPPPFPSYMYRKIE